MKNKYELNKIYLDKSQHCSWATRQKILSPPPTISTGLDCLEIGRKTEVVHGGDFRVFRFENTRKTCVLSASRSPALVLERRINDVAFVCPTPKSICSTSATVNPVFRHASRNVMIILLIMFAHDNNCVRNYH